MITPTLAIIIAVLITFGLCLTVFLYLSKKALNKFEMLEKALMDYEETLLTQDTYLKQVSVIINESRDYLQRLDERGIFQGDDEVGFFFSQMKAVQNTVDTYIAEIKHDKEKTKNT